MTDVAVATCPACGEPTTAEDRFCEACGHELTPAPVPAPPAGPLAVPSAAGVTTCPACGSEAQWLDGYCGVCGARQPDPRDHQELELPGLGAVSDRGRRHARNEDAFAVAVPVAPAVAPASGFLVVVVCDGVSTTVRPEYASQAACDAAAGVLVAGDPASPDHRAAFAAAREAVLAVDYEPHPDLGPPACTYLAAVITDQVVTMATFGDCRAYWLAPDLTLPAVTQLTVDDSWATGEIAAGRPKAEVYADSRAHAITRWLGADADPTWQPAIVRFEPPGPGRLLLCSDGLWNYAEAPEQLAAVVAEGGTEPLGLARHLVEFANRAGGSDNITAVVVDLPLAAGASATPESP